MMHPTRGLALVNSAQEKKSMTKIDRNIPFPVHREGHGYPWHQLDVGESFLYEGSILAAQQAALYYSRKTNKTFKARTLDNKVRVWRIE